ncbi:MAG: NADP-reducing hydrogenase subunit HndC [bacterium ADurb.Bin429]|nr:MAG: NADP-reducing hydrogenase subunit HndC [bacterium ADurb.Bin429]
MSGTTTGEKVTFTLNGRQVTAEPGETVLSVARRLDVHIPTLCFHESVSSYGACRLCLVEVFWGKRSKLVTSCLYIPYPDDRIETDNARIHGVRKLVLELLLARSPHVEAIRELAREYCVEVPRFRPSAVTADATRCVLCDLCVRVCAEVVGQSAIGYAGRGSERVITVPFGEQAEECIGCGACVFICPTQALSYEDIAGQRLMKELNTSVPLVACRVCGEHFATEKQLAKLRERITMPDELVDVCPRCRGTEFTRVLDEALVTKPRV